MNSHAPLQKGNKTPYETNWLVFCAMVEAALLEFGSEGDYERGPIDHALEQHVKWYKGDGWYGDGEHFHLDYYNSYVIQPMIHDVCAVLKAHGNTGGEFYDTELERLTRFAVQQERLVDNYSSTDSVYLCSTVFLPIGLPADNDRLFTC